MKEYALAVAGMALLTTLISLLSPAKKYAAIIDGVLKLCMLLTLITPVLGWIRQNRTTFFTTQNISAVNAAYINNSYALAIEKYLSTEYGVTAEVEAEVSLDNASEGNEVVFTRIVISVKNFGMNEKDEHIHIRTKIGAEISERLKCENVEVTDDSG
ncbi:MAG: hypothetical protein J6Z36_00865 [Clostridia bacterium]|nr:hypothetical protein [Clostridia bacterium]